MAENWCSRKDPSIERVHLQVSTQQKSFKISQDGHLQPIHIQQRFQTLNTQAFSKTPQPPTYLDLPLTPHFFQHTPSCDHHKSIITNHHTLPDISTHPTNNHFSGKTIQLEALKWLDGGLADDKIDNEDSGTLERRLEAQGFVKLKSNEVKSSASSEMMNEMRASYKLLSQQLQELKQRWVELEQLPCWNSYESWCKKNDKIQLLKLNLEAVKQKLRALKGVAEGNMVDWGRATKDPYHNLHLDFSHLYQQFKEFHISFLASGYRKFPRQQDAKASLNSKNKVSQAFLGQLNELQRSLDDLQKQDGDYPQKLETYQSELLLLIKQIIIFNLEWQDLKLGQSDLIDEVNDNLDRVKEKFQENWASLHQIPLDKPQSDQHVTSKMTNYFKPHLQHLATLHLLISSYIRNGGAIGGGNGGAGGLETKLDKIYKELEKESENIDSLLLPWEKYTTLGVGIKADKDKIIKMAVNDISKWDTKGSIFKTKNQNLSSRGVVGSGDNKAFTRAYAKNQTTTVIYGQGDNKNKNNLHKTSDFSNTSAIYREGDNTSVSVESITSNMVDDNRNLEGYVVVASTKTTTITTRASGRHDNTTVNKSTDTLTQPTIMATSASIQPTSLHHHTTQATLAADDKQQLSTVTTDIFGYNATKDTKSSTTNNSTANNNKTSTTTLNSVDTTTTTTTTKNTTPTDTTNKHIISTTTTPLITSTPSSPPAPHQTSIKKTTTVKTNLQPSTTTIITNKNKDDISGVSTISTEKLLHTTDQSQLPTMTHNINTSIITTTTTTAANIKAKASTDTSVTTAQHPPSHNQQYATTIITTPLTDTTTTTVKEIYATTTSKTAEDPKILKMKHEAEEEKRKWVERFELLRAEFVKTPSGLALDDHIHRLKGFEQEAKVLQKVWIDSSWKVDACSVGGECDHLLNDVLTMISKKMDEKKDLDRKKKRQEDKRKEEEESRLKKEEKYRKEEEERKRKEEEKMQKEDEERKRKEEERMRKEDEEERRREDKKQMLNRLDVTYTTCQNVLDELHELEYDTNTLDVIKNKFKDVSREFDGIKKDWGGLKVKWGANKDGNDNVEAVIRKCGVIAQKIDKTIVQKQAEIDRQQKTLNTSFNTNLKRLQNLLKTRQNFEGNPAKKDGKSLENDLTLLRDFDNVICRLFNNLKGDYTDLLDLMGTSASNDVINKYDSMKRESEGRLGELDGCKKRVLDALAKIEATDRKTRELGWMVNEMEEWMDAFWIDYDVIKPKDKSLEGLQKFNVDLKHLQEEVSMKTGVIEEIMRRMDKLSNNLDEGIKAKGHLTIKNWKGLNKQIKSDQAQCDSAIKVKSELNVNSEALYDFLAKLKVDFDKNFPREGCYDVKMAFVKERAQRLTSKNSQISKLRDMLFMLGDETGDSKVGEAWEMMEKKIKEEEKKLEAERTGALQTLQDKLDQTHTHIKTNEEKDSMKRDINGYGRVGLGEDTLVGYVRELDEYEEGLDGKVGVVEAWFKKMGEEFNRVLAADSDVMKKVETLKNTVKDKKLKISNRKKNISDVIKCMTSERKDITDTEHLHKSLSSLEGMTYPRKDDVTVQAYVQALQTYEGVLDGRVGDIEKLGELKGNIQLHTTTPSQQREAALKACEEGQKRWKEEKRRVKEDLDRHNSYLLSLPAWLEMLGGMKTSLSSLKNNNNNNNNNNNSCNENNNNNNNPNNSNNQTALNEEDWELVEQMRKKLGSTSKHMQEGKKIWQQFKPERDGWVLLWEEVKRLLAEFRKDHQSLHKAIDATDAVAPQDHVVYDYSQLEALEAWLDTAEARLVDSNKPHPMEFSAYHHASDTIKQLNSGISEWRSKVERIKQDAPKMARQTSPSQEIIVKTSKAVDRYEQVSNRNKIWLESLFRFLCSPDFLQKQVSRLDDAISDLKYDLVEVSESFIVPQSTDSRVNYILRQLKSVQNRLKELLPSVSAVRKLNSLASSPPMSLTPIQQKYMKKTKDRLDEVNTKIGLLENRIFTLVDELKKVVAKRAKVSEKTMAALKSLETSPNNSHWTNVLSRGARVAVPIQVLMLMLVGVAAIVPVCESSACIPSVIMSFGGGGPPM